MRPRNAALRSLALLALLLLGSYGCASEAVNWYHKGVETESLEEKIAYYTNAIELNPDYAFAYNNRGNANRAMGFHDAAITDFTTAIALLEMKGDKHYLAFAYNNRGNVYRGKGLYGRAIEDFNKAMELKPGDALAYNHLAWVLATSPDAVLRNGKQAVELAERAIELDRDAHNLDTFSAAHNLDTLAAAYAEVGRFEEAISTQLQAIDLPKKEGDESSAANFDRHLERYRTHKPWRMNEPEGGPDHPTTDTKLNNLAELYRAQGKYAEAEPLYKRALAIRENALGPHHQDVATSLNNLALLYRAQGRHAEAEPLYKRSLAIREKARQQEEARKRETQQKLEALSGRYITAGGQSQWDISFRDNRFEARYLRKGRRTLLYDGTVTGTRISGRAHHYGSSFCRQSPTTPLYGSVDLRQKSIEINYGDYNFVEMRRHKRCVPITTQEKWTQADRQ